MAPHYLAGPWGLPRGLDQRLGDYLRREHHGSAVTVLRDAIAEIGRQPRLLALLAYCRYRDAAEVMLDERLAASQESLRLIDEALEAGAPAEVLGPLRQEVEGALAEETAAELATLAKLPEDGSLEGVDPQTLRDAAHRLWDAGEPARAAQLFEALAEQEQGLEASLDRARAGLCYADANDSARARPHLMAALDLDWNAPAGRAARSVLEASYTWLLLEEVDPDRFQARFDEAAARGRALKLPFPSVWPNQERVLEAALKLGASEAALETARRIEEGREELPRALTEKIRLARSRAIS